jgi:RND superfamily putative drug exporter
MSRRARPPLTARLAGAAARRPGRSLLAWLLLMIAAGAVVATLLGSGLTSTGDFTGTPPESIQGSRLLEQRLTGKQNQNEIVIVHSASLTADAPAFSQHVNDLAGKILDLGSTIVTTAVTPYLTKDPSMISHDKHAVLIVVTMAGDLDRAMKDLDKLQAVVKTGQTGGFTTAETGSVSLNKEINALAISDLQRAEVLGVPAAMLVLIVVFGAVLTAFVPVILAMLAMVLALAMTALVGQLHAINVFAVNMISMMSLAVCIDYCLFIVSRYREERTAGREKVDAITAAGGTANRAVFFSGMTVIVALVGLLIAPAELCISLAAGAMFAVAGTQLTALVMLPALLGLLGDRVNALRLPVIGRRRESVHGAGRELFWERAAHRIMRRPGLSLALSAGVLLLAAAPVLLMKTGSSDIGTATLPQHLGSVQAYRTLERDFSLAQVDPVQIVVDGQVNTPAVKQAIANLETKLRADSRFAAVKVTSNTTGDLALVTTAVAGDPAAQQAQNMARYLRTRIVAPIFKGVPAKTYVSGSSAFVLDYRAFFDKWLRIGIVVVLCLSFVLLMVAFRSIAVAFTAILVNLLSVGAAYGLLVLVFQEGIGARLLGFTKVNAIEAWVPLVMFCMLFGLSMDYQVFLLSRIRERFDSSGDTRDAVAHGIGRTAGIITGAALIMVAVFAGVAGGELVMFQQMGFGLAIAVLLDATIVRTVLVPSAMALLGERNWYLPRWLQWLPNVSIDGHGLDAPQARELGAPRPLGDELV